MYMYKVSLFFAVNLFQKNIRQIWKSLKILQKLDDMRKKNLKYEKNLERDKWMPTWFGISFQPAFSIKIPRAGLWFRVFW